MEEKQKSTVRIGGLEYTLSADASEEYIHRVALYVDRKMNQIKQQRSGLSTAMIAVLAAVNITDELFKAREGIAQEDARPLPQEEAPPEPLEQTALFNVTDLGKARGDNF